MHDGSGLVVLGAGAPRDVWCEVARMLARAGCVRDSVFETYVRGLLDLSTGSVLAPGNYAALALAIVAHVVPSDVLLRLRTGLTAQPLVMQAAVHAGLMFLFVGASLGAPAIIYFQF